jgi:surface polysaccharide O-acyltransferase-like enzyme
MATQCTTVRSWPTSQKRDVDHLCVDNVRYWSMFAVIAVHSLIAWGIHSDSGIGWEIQIALLQAAKFGTIGFYLISGFLLGQRVERYSPYEYFFRRLKSVALPWAIWAGIFTLLPFSKALLLGGDTGSLGASLLHYAGHVLLFSPYWFVPNFFIALMLLLVLRRHLDDVRAGIGLLTLSLFYGVNIYGKWIPANHTYAAFGFVFYLWLGSWIARHPQMLLRFVDRIGWGSVLLGILGTASLSLGEAHLLNSLKADNVVNTLRVSNQLFSVVAIIGLTKLRHPTWPRFIDVRAHTYGLYLLHPICIFLLTRGADMIFIFASRGGKGTLLETYTPVWVHPMTSLVLWASMFLLCYSLSLLVMKAISANGLDWLFGRTTKRTEALQAHRPFPLPIELKPAA